MLDQKPTNDEKYLVDAAIRGNEKEFCEYFIKCRDECNLVDALKKIAKCEEVIHPKIKKRFCSILASHDIRQSVTAELREDDLDFSDVALLNAFYKLLPKYNGEDRLLYRGERYERFIKGTYGWSWTPEYVPGDVEVGAGGYAYDIANPQLSVRPGKKSVVLKVSVPRELIFCNLSEHQTIKHGELEFIVDYRFLTIQPEAIETFIPESYTIICLKFN